MGLCAPGEWEGVGSQRLMTPRGVHCDRVGVNEFSSCTPVSVCHEGGSCRLSFGLAVMDLYITTILSHNTTNRPCPRTSTDKIIRPCVSTVSRKARVSVDHIKVL